MKFCALRTWIWDLMMCVAVPTKISLERNVTVTWMTLEKIVPHSVHGMGCNWRINCSKWQFIVISFNSIMSCRKALFQLHGMRLNWWTSWSGWTINFEGHDRCLSIQWGIKRNKAFQWVFCMENHQQLHGIECNW